jgi:DNA-directed RNA polymerase subunit L
MSTIYTPVAICVCYQNDKDENNYTFKIESRGQLTEKKILKLAVLNLIKKLEQILSQIPDNDKNEGELEINDEDHTVGNILSYGLQNNKNVKLFEGYSHEVINTLINTNVFNKEPILFYLDAHFSGGETEGKLFKNGCPILEELNIISNRNIKGDIIFIDDMRLMGKASWGGTDGCSKYPKTFFVIFALLSRKTLNLSGSLF